MSLCQQSGSVAVLLPVETVEAVALPANGNRPSTEAAKRPRRRFRWTLDLDRRLREGYRGDEESKQRAIDQICLGTGWPRQACWDRARALHLCAPQNISSERRTWTGDEVSLLRTLFARKKTSEIAHRLSRTERSVREKVKRLDLEYPYPAPEEGHDSYSVAEVADSIGRDPRVVYRWIESGKLKTMPPPFPGAELRVSEDDFWDFVTVNNREVFLQKLSRNYLEWMCSELLLLARPKIEQKGGRRKQRDKAPAHEVAALPFEDDLVMSANA